MYFLISGNFINGRGPFSVIEVESNAIVAVFCRERNIIMFLIDHIKELVSVS